MFPRQLWICLGVGCTLSAATTLYFHLTGWGAIVCGVVYGLAAGRIARAWVNHVEAKRSR